MAHTYYNINVFSKLDKKLKILFEKIIYIVDSNSILGKIVLFIDPYLLNTLFFSNNMLIFLII